jgi:L-ascorbate metabolism protein UlaG (beta-lactamase superfamily)
MKKTVIWILAFIGIITLSSMLILNQSKFGQSPKGVRLERIMKSPNYRDGEFKNLHETSVITPGKSRFSVMMGFMFQKKTRVQPTDSIPVVKKDIKSLHDEQDVLIWFGHSSYFMRIQGKTFLVDPVFSNFAAPFSFVNKAFKGTTQFHAEDFPSIDFLIITHDHWDHLDNQTVMDLKPKIKQVVCGLGVGQDFESWGFDPKIISELDWYESITPDTNWKLTATPARHYSGRGLKSNQTLWASYVLQTPGYSIFIGGDSGYDTHFAEIGKKFGPFKLAILEQGQYSENWNQIHLLPRELQKTASDLNAKMILPVHNSKFALASHEWDEPLKKVTGNK